MRTFIIRTAQVHVQYDQINVDSNIPISMSLDHNLVLEELYGPQRSYEKHIHMLHMLILPTSNFIYLI